MSKLSIYNSLTKRQESFEPINPPHVGMYVCGPTVYNEVHLGNVRTFVSFDIIYRWLQYLGYRVRYVRNITDVGHLQDNSEEDKLQKQAKLEKIEPMEVAQKYSNDFHKVMLQFNNLEPSIEPLASGHLIEQIDMIQDILDHGYGYEVNGSVYFDVEKYNKEKGYGILSGRKIEDLLNNTRELDGQSDKRNPLDFAIWKKASPDHIMRWPSPWSDGFPGWHLECSAMSTKYLGERFDIHGGGIDLKFPHHECEIAQNIGAHGNEGPNFWVHTNMLTVNGTKMSKSLGNGFTPAQLINGDHDLLEQPYSPMTVRFFMLQTHYSSTLDFSNQALQAAEKGYQRLMKALDNLSHLKYQFQGQADKKLNEDVVTHLDNFIDHMNDDFNTARALAELFELTNKINSFANGQVNLSELQESSFDRLKNEFPIFVQEVLGLRVENQAEEDNLDSVVQILIDMRKQARADKNFATSDQIRDQLKEAGIQLLDGPEGTKWEKI